MKKQLFTVLARTSIGAIAIATAMPALAHPADDSAATTAVIVAQDAPAAAPAAPDESKKDTDIVVTGTQIRNVTPAGATIVSQTAAQIQAEGATNANEILANIPQAASIFQGLPSVAGGTAVNIAVSILPFQSISLRNLPNVNTGAGEFTLQLLDGHRIVPVGTDATGGQGTDPQAIPASAVQRVEIMPDGGSAVYGSNAVAGVINYITRDSFDGIEVSARGGLASGTYKQFDGTVTAGTKWDTGSIFGSFTYSTHDALFGAMTDYIHGWDANPNSPLFNTPLGLNCVNPNIAITTGTAPGVPGSRRIYPLTGPNGTIQPYTTNNGSNGNGGASASTANGIAGGNRCNSSNDFNSYFPQVTAYNAIVGLKQEITPNLTFSFKANYEKSDTEAYSPNNLTATIKAGAPNYRQVCNDVGGIQVAGLQSCTAGGTNGFLAGDSTATQTIFTNYNTVLPSSINAFVHEELWQVTPELTWNFAKDWQVRALLSYGQSKTSGINGTINAVQQAAELASGAINPYNLAGSTPGAFTNLIEYTDEIGAFHILDAKVVADGPVPMLSLPAGQVHTAIGAEYYSDSLTQWAPGTLSPTPNQFVLPTPQTYIQNTKSVFGELAIPLVSESMNIPLISSLNVNASGRYDSYNDVGDTFNYMIGATWAPIPWVKVRANYNTSFAAPSPISLLTSVYGAEANNSTTNNVLVNPTASLPYFPGYVPPGDLTGGVLGVGSVAAIAQQGAKAQSGTGGTPIGIEETLSAGTAPGTGPQTSKTWSIGADISPPFVPGLSFGASYYDLKISNVIASPLNPSVASVFQFHPELIYCAGGTNGTTANAAATCATPIPLAELLANGYLTARTNGTGGLVTAASLTQPGQGSVGSGSSVTFAQVMANYCGPVQFASKTCAAGSYSIFNIVDNRTRNLGKLFSTGLDFHAAYHTDVPWGSIDGNVSGTLNLTTVQQSGSVLTNYQAFGVSPWRLSAMVGTTWGGLRAQVTWEHSAGYVINPTSVGVVGTAVIPGSGDYGQTILGAYDTFDLFFRYKFDSMADKNGIFKGLAVTLNVNNFLDNDPPILGGGYGNGATLGRQWLLGITKDFK